MQTSEETNAPNILSAVRTMVSNLLKIVTSNISLFHELGSSGASERANAVEHANKVSSAEQANE